MSTHSLAARLIRLSCTEPNEGLAERLEVIRLRVIANYRDPTFTPRLLVAPIRPAGPLTRMEERMHAARCRVYDDRKEPGR